MSPNTARPLDVVQALLERQDPTRIHEAAA